MKFVGRKCDEKKRRGNVSAIPNMVAVLRLQRLPVRVLYHLGEEDRLYLYLEDERGRYSLILSRRAINFLSNSESGAWGSRH